MAYTANKTEGGYSMGKSKGMAYNKQKKDMAGMPGYNAGAIKDGSASATLSYDKSGSRDRGIKREVSKSPSIIGF